MTVTEAAKRIGVSASKLYQLVAARAIAHHRIGGKIIVFEEDVSAYLAGCRVAAATAKVAAPHRQINLKHLRLH